MITASLTIEKTGGILAGLIGSFSLMALMLLYNFHTLEPLNQNIQYDVSTMTIFLLSYTGLFAGVAFISNVISDLVKNVIKRGLSISQENGTLVEKINIIEKDCYKLKNEKKELDELVTISESISHLDHDINTPLCVISLSLTRIKQAAAEFRNENLAKSSNEISAAINDISLLLRRLIPLKQNEFIKNKINEG